MWGLFALFGGLGVASSLPEEKYLAYTGTAVERHTLNLLYEEHHVLRYLGGRLAERVVLYTCAGGSPFARKSVSYVDPVAPDFLLEDASNGLREGVRAVAGVRSVFFRSDHVAVEKAAPLPRVPGLVVDAGFDEFIRANWPLLLEGKPLPLHFLVPSRLEDIAFEVQHLRSDTHEGARVELFRLKLASALSWFVRPIDVSYGTADRVLVRYTGVSDLRDGAGNNLQALINFPSKDRIESDAQSMSAARQAPLTACKE